MSVPLPLRATNFFALRYKKLWRGSVTAAFLNPLLYLGALGIGLGHYIDGNSASSASIGGVRYVTYLAPGLLAAAGMQVASTESTWPVLGALKWEKDYLAMRATPLSPRDIHLGHLVWVALRILVTVTVFCAIMGIFGAWRSALALLAIPAALLLGMSVAFPLAAFAITRQDDSGFAAIERFAITPMFLFSGTFYPISQLPAGIRPLAYVTPLWHGVQLCRTLALGTATLWPTIGHMAFLAGVAAVGLLAGRRTYQRRLAP